MKYTLFLFLLAVTFVFVIGFLSHDSYAISSIISDKSSCESIGGTWNALSICSVSRLEIKGTITINHGITLQNSGKIEINSGTINNLGTIVNSGTIYSLYGKITNSGTIKNSGTIDSNSNIVVINSGAIDNSGEIFYRNIDNSGTITISGHISAYENTENHVLTNSGTIIITNNGIMSTYGSLFNDQKGVINNSGTIENSKTIDWAGSPLVVAAGTIKNSGIINNNADGTIKNSYKIENVNTIKNSGIMYNLAGKTSTGKPYYNEIINMGTLENNAGGTIDNLAVIKNSNIISNSGVINNSHLIENSDNDSELIIDRTGVVNNFGTIANDGHLTNFGTITNSGTIIGDNLDNFETITNSGTIRHYRVTNSGTIENFNTLKLDLIENSGAISNNADGTIIGHTTINNFIDGKISNSGTIEITISAIFNNYGTIRNTGTLIISSFEERLYAIFNNYGTIRNTGTIDNMGKFNDCGGSLEGQISNIQPVKIVCASPTPKLESQNQEPTIESTVSQKPIVEQKIEEITPSTTSKGGCLIATATYGSELAPQVQILRELRNNAVLGTNSGTSFMAAFNQFYYSFSPAIADWERQSPVFKEAVKMAITPMLSTLSILNYVDIDSEQEMLGYGVGIILLNLGLYFAAPAVVILKLRRIRS